MIRRDRPTPIDEALGERQRDGVIHIGRGTSGCRHCGETAVHMSANGRVAIHHPAAECCAGAIEDAIAARELELATKRQAAERQVAEIRDAQAKASTAIGREAAQASERAAAMANGYQARLPALKTEAEAIKAELARLRQLLELKRRPPVPYAEAIA